MPEPPAEATIAWEMAQWEIHALRTLVTQLLGHVRMHRDEQRAEHSPASCDALDATALRLRKQFAQNRERALWDDEYRRKALTPTAFTQDEPTDVPTV